MGTLDFLKNLEAPTAQVVSIDIDQIEPDAKQPRTRFRPVDGNIDEATLAKLEELADDIAAVGLTQPIIVRELADGRYSIIAGERRWRAFCFNRDRGTPDSQAIPAIVRQDLVASKLRLVQLSENLQRDDLTDLEVAQFLRDTLEDNPELQKQELAKVMNKSSQFISRVLALLDPKWSDVVDSGLITYASLLEQFRPLPPEVQEQLKAKARAEGRPLTSGDIRSAKDLSKGQQKAPPQPTGVAGVNAELAAKVEELIAAQAPENENYTPSAAAKAAPATRERIKDSGGDAVIPSGTGVLSAVAQQKREAKLTLHQLATMINNGALPDLSHTVSLSLPVDEMKQSITALGGKLPEDDSQLPTVLAATINKLS
ncbi:MULTISPECIES: ParB/RepB/Spo0J family partition protein [unclassified Caballeronia]|uniref:ParB/RepB/Spo0J family partition protein n=1 Tax=unclassified Caballeronia TaxID=2646786 RepID=UPI002854F6F0|nr:MULTISPECIES: ParB/RepB/Spo0J family partition protein [unclassified Caballeronia]MDR5777003.1 ParB/RepB/Spo0J family partition protein [Caballeronia sp. LZ002]MDR5852422.1 ParB/RepB/Spo0J family partition protein [Caballeronia sp. LZ003]